MADVPPAKVAVLRYDTQREGAPRLVAKGRGEVAKRILDLAREHDIPLYRDPDLLELLLALEVNEEIPEELFALVAEVLAFLYRLNRYRP